MRLLMIMLVFILMPWNIASAPSKPIQEDKPITKQTALASRNGFSMSYDYIITAYIAGPESTGKNPGEEGYGITASGAKVTEGTTCACPPQIPLGTKVFIEGIGYRICQDRGADIQGNRIDVYMDSLQDALRYGRQSAKVRILYDEKTSDSKNKTSM